MAADKQMPEPVVFKCQKCGNEFDTISILPGIVKYGVFLLVGEKDWYFGWNCPNCSDATTNLRHFSENPLLDVIASISDGLATQRYGSLCYQSLPYKFGETDQRALGKAVAHLTFEIQAIRPEDLLPEFDDDQHPPPEYSTFHYHTTAIGPAIAVWWLDKAAIHDLVKLENDTGQRAFPRYQIYDPLYSLIGDFCWQEHLCLELFEDMQWPVEIREIFWNPAKRKIKRSFDFTAILDAVHFSKASAFRSEGETKTIIHPTSMSSFRMDENEVESALEGLQHEKFSQSIWNAFHSSAIQDLLDQLAQEFVADYLSLVQQVDCSFDAIWNLKESYLKMLHEAVVSRRRREKVKEKALARERERVEEAEKKFPSVKIISDDPAINDIKIQISKLAHLKGADSFFIYGERGTGKELFARAIHEASKQPGPLVKVDCGAISEKLFESEMYGHVKGAFTGADENRIGFLEQADQGTVFFDEIGNLLLSHQPKLLRALQDREFVPVGSNEPKLITSKFIFATNKDLDKLVEKERFMPDLYDRFKWPMFSIPTLAERKVDIPLLIKHFIEKYDSDSSQADRDPFKISDECMAFLTNYQWPGNVRELEGILKMTILIRRGDNDRSVIEIKDLPNEIQASASKQKTAGKIERATDREKYGRLPKDDFVLIELEKKGYLRKDVARKYGVDPATVSRRYSRIKKTYPQD